MVPLAWRMISKEKVRFLITVSGVGCAVMLMLFLVGVYEGVKRDSTSYVVTTPADIWICQKNSTNLLRTSSFLFSSIEDEIRKVKGVNQVAGLLRFIATARINSQSVTLFIFGFDPKSGLGAPLTLIRGRSIINSREIIIDKTFAAKHKLALGDRLHIQGYDFRVVGISRGTNAFVTQFAFTTLEDAQLLIGLPGIISFFLIRTEASADKTLIIDSLKKQFPSLAVFDKQEFVRNNLEEMETGVLPVLWAIAFFGALVSTAIITLMVYGAILERREDYALLKAIGARQTFLVSLVLKQSLWGALAGFVFGLLLHAVSTPLLMAWVPEISSFLTFKAVGFIFAASLVIGVMGSWLPLHKLSHIYPAEVFRA